MYFGLYLSFKMILTHKMYKIFLIIGEKENICEIKTPPIWQKGV